MRFLVTGGAGYIGTELVRSLAQLEQAEEIRVFDNLSRGSYHSFLGDKLRNADKVRFVFGDILDSRSLQRVLEDIDFVYHLAAKVTTPFADADPNSYEQVNHWGTAELVYALEKQGQAHLVHISSTSVYGSTDGLVDESSPLQPRTFYGISKLRGEEHVMRLADSGHATIVRCGNVFGYSPGMRFEAVINKFAFETNFKNRISIHGNGRQSRAFIHVDHLTSVLSKLPASGSPAGVFNLVANNIEILELVDVFKQLRPSLEFIFLDQHLELRSLRVDTELKLSRLMDTSGAQPVDVDVKILLEKFCY